MKAARGLLSAGPAAVLWANLRAGKRDTVRPVRPHSSGQAEHSVLGAGWWPTRPTQEHKESLSGLDRAGSRWGVAGPEAGNGRGPVASRTAPPACSSVRRVCLGPSTGSGSQAVGTLMSPLTFPCARSFLIVLPRETLCVCPRGHGRLPLKAEQLEGEGCLQPQKPWPVVPGQTALCTLCSV